MSQPSPEAPKNPSYLLKRVNGVQRVVLFYDPDVFEDDVLLSASLLTGEDVPFKSHYNTLHFPAAQYGNGIVIYGIPSATRIIGLRRVLPASTHKYSISDRYDPSHLYTYAWEITEGAGTITPVDARHITVEFADDTYVCNLQCTITNGGGAQRRVHALINVGIIPQKLMVLRGTKINEN